MPECPDCETFFSFGSCPTCGYRPMTQADPAPRIWHTLKGPVLSKEHNSQCAAICKAVLEGKMDRIVGVNAICDLAASWGMPIEDARLSA